MKLKTFLGMLICISFLFVSSAWAGDVAINSTNFPDEIFREFVNQFDTSGNGLLSDAERRAVEEIWIAGKGISSLKGIERFTALKYLGCSNNNLRSCIHNNRLSNIRESYILKEEIIL